MTTDVTRRLHGGRALTGHDDPDGEHVAGWPDVAYEALRAINHLTLGGAIPAPVVYEVLGNLKGVGHMLPQALSQLGTGLTASLEAFDVYDHKGDPADNVTQARAYLLEAAEKSRELGELLEAAQGAINSQGYHGPSDSDGEG